LNKTWRSKDKVTDVLSFPYYAPTEFKNLHKSDVYEEIYLCVPQCRKQAKHLKHSASLEALILFIHSIYHGLGFDHETEEEYLAMLKAETKTLNLLRNIFIK
nr:rRNA maturation RNase YbeY [Candidatus Gracilibacteria bacterium]